MKCVYMMYAHLVFTLILLRCAQLARAVHVCHTLCWKHHVVIHSTHNWYVKRALSSLRFISITCSMCTTIAWQLQPSCQCITSGSALRNKLMNGYTNSCPCTNNVPMFQLLHPYIHTFCNMHNYLHMHIAMWTDVVTIGMYITNTSSMHMDTANIYCQQFLVSLYVCV